MKKQLLDPIGTMCKLISLNFLDANTKISICNHVLSLDKPYQFQWLERSCRGDSRENISELYYVIIRIIDWFLVPAMINIDDDDDDTDDDTDDNIRNNTEDINDINDISNSSNTSTKSFDSYNYLYISKSEELRRLVRYLCDGFRKLQYTYKYGNVILVLQYYINILEDGLDNINNISRLPKLLVEEDMEYENLIDYDKLKNLWTVENLTRVCNLYDECFNVYTNENIPNSNKEVLIDGYQKSIYHILEENDKIFVKLVDNSNRG